MNLAVWLPILGMILATVITAVFAPSLARRAEKRRQERDALQAKADKADDISVEYNQMLFSQLEAAQRRHDADMEDVRRRLAESERLRIEQGRRLGEVERKVIEFENGLRVALGYVLIPRPLWLEIRERLPDLPPTRFPGERVVDTGPGDTGGAQ